MEEGRSAGLSCLLWVLVLGVFVATGLAGVAVQNLRGF